MCGAFRFLRPITDGYAITFSRALRHASLLLLQSAACYGSHAPWPYVHDAPPSHDVRLHDAWPPHHGAEQRAYDVLLPYDDVLQLSLTCGFLQLAFALLGFSRFVALTEHREVALVPGDDVACDVL